MALQFRIDRLPSGIRYNTRRTIAHVNFKEVQSRSPPQTRIYGREHIGVPKERPMSHDTVEQYSLFSHTTEPAKNPESSGEIPPGLSVLKLRDTRDGLGGSSRSPSQQQPTPASPIQPDVSEECLPLLKVSAEVLVDGNVARTSLLQRFSNTTKESIDEARYTFPLYDSAVVVAFTCTIGEEKEITGRVQARDKARKLFKKAVDKLETAALLEEHTAEIFETVIGNIPAETYVSVQVEYIHELKASILDDGEEVLQAIIPMSIAPRYGGLGGVEQRTNSDTKVNEDGLEIVVKVSDSIKTKKIHCNHHVSIKENVPITSTRVSSLFDLGKAKEKDPSSTATGITQTIARFASDTAIMDEDFIVSIENHPSHPIRSRAVLSPPDEDGHAALMVSLKTAEVFKGEARADKFDGEIIFLLDRSGSMDDSHSFGPSRRTFKRSKISTLREAIFVSLASLPKTCHFNIVSFGSDTELLWEKSNPYTQNSLDYARTYAKGLQADFGGTNLCHALERVVDSRRPETTSTQIILVTDGEVEPEDVLASVWEVRQNLGDRIRFFALGIGYNVPHRLINKIGEFGGGYGEVVDIEEKPQWADRLILMLSSGIMPKTWTCEIDLGPGFERQCFLHQTFGKNSSEHQEYAKSKTIPFIQAPYPMPPLHPFAFRSAYFLLDLRTGDAPTQLILSATADETKVKSEHTLLIEKATADASIIQQLAAKTILLNMEAEANRLDLSRSQEDFARQNAINLGTKYSITSRWTSFVAVEGSSNVVDEVELYKAAFRQGNIKDYLHSSKEQEVAPWSPFQAPHFYQPPANPFVPLDSFGMSNDSISERQAAPILKRKYSRRSKIREDISKDETDETPPLRIYNSIFERQAAPIPKGKSSWRSKIREDISKIMEDISKDETNEYQAHDSTIHIRRPITWIETAESQSAEGLFQIDKTLRQNLSSHFTADIYELVDNLLLKLFPLLTNTPTERRWMIVDTAMIVHHFRTHLSSERDVWDMMIDKAETAVLKALGALETSELAGLEAALDLSSMHEHADDDADKHGAADDVRGYCPFLPPGAGSCIVCRKGPRPDDLNAEGGGGRVTGTLRFECGPRLGG